MLILTIWLRSTYLNLLDKNDIQFCFRGFKQWVIFTTFTNSLAFWYWNTVIFQSTRIIITFSLIKNYLSLDFLICLKKNKLTENYDASSILYEIVMKSDGTTDSIVMWDIIHIKTWTERHFQWQIGMIYLLDVSFTYFFWLVSKSPIKLLSTCVSQKRKKKQKKKSYKKVTTALE